MDDAKTALTAACQVSKVRLTSADSIPPLRMANKLISSEMSPLGLLSEKIYNYVVIVFLMALLGCPIPHIWSGSSALKLPHG
jgi:hypothetical protein